MFPFDLSGPAFLLFYAVVSLVVVKGLARWRRAREDRDVPDLDLSDPYPIAYLRAGADEVARIAVLSLIERGLLRREGRLLTSAPDAAYTPVPVEQALMTHFRKPTLADAVLGRPVLANACDVYAKTLERLGLLPDAACVSARGRMAAIAVAFLWLLAAVKIHVAVSSGHRNVWFLLVLALFFGGWVHLARNPDRTWLGERRLEDLRRLATNRAKATSGSLDASTVLLASVLGLAAVPAAYAEVKDQFHFPPAGGGGVEVGGGGGGGGDGGCGGGGGGCGGCGGCGGA